MKRKTLINAIQTKFECQRCNECCKQKGFVYITGRDIERMSEYKKMSEEDFKIEYCEKDDDNWVLKSHPDDACIFLVKEGCSINPAKPTQCKTYPFKWRDPDSFKYCEGIKKLERELEVCNTSITTNGELK